MLRFIIRRLFGAVAVVFIVTTAVFFILRYTSDPVALLVSPDATQEDMDQLRAQLGLDRPLSEYADFVEGLLQGDLGESFRYSVPVFGLVIDRLPETLLLTGTALLFALLLAVPMGLLCATRRNSLTDVAVSAVSFVGLAIPVFWLGQMLIIVVAVRWGWLPTSGYGGWRHLILPAVTLGTYPLAQFTRIIRSEMIEILGQDYIRTARAKGLHERRVVIGHALRNAAIPIITMAGLNAGALLGGAIITETIFAWPGLGRLLIQAIEFRDLPLLQGAVLFVALVNIGMNVLVDLLYGVADPRAGVANR